MTLLPWSRFYQVFLIVLVSGKLGLFHYLMERSRTLTLEDEKGDAEDDPLQPFYEKMLIEMIESDSELEFFKEPERRLKLKNKGLSINDCPPPPLTRT